MAKFCEVCGKGKMSGNNVSHSNRKSRTSWAPNIQVAHAIINGASKKIHVCTRCMRSGKIERA